MITFIAARALGIAYCAKVYETVTTIKNADDVRRFGIQMTPLGQRNGYSGLFRIGRKNQSLFAGGDTQDIG